MSLAFRKWAGVLVLSLLCVNCGSTPPSRLYLLSATEGSPRATGEGPAVGVGPITFPEYLDRSQMVIRRDGELDLLEFERWGERLPSNFLAVLVENLAARTGSDRIYSFRWPGSLSLDYRLTGSVSRFEVDASGQALLAVQWQIGDAEGAGVVPTRRSRFTESSTPGDHADAAAALSRALAAFSDEVAAALADLE